MRMHKMIDILGLLVEGNTAQVNILLVLGQLLILAWHNQFCKGTGRIDRLLALGEQLNLISLRLPLAEISQKTKFIIHAVTVQIIQLGWNFLAIYRNDGLGNFTILAQIQDNRFVVSLYFGRISHLHLHHRLRFHS